MNTQIIDEEISVILDSNIPISIFWKGRKYNITKIGLHHNFYKGKILMHVFSVVSENLFFKLEFNTNTLIWKLLEIYDDNL